MGYILIAEDDRDIQLLVQRKLEMSGYSDIWMTNDGQEALSHALENPPSLLILDVMLPSLDGLSICAEVKKTLSPAPPILIMSARGQQTHLQEGTMAGADAYIIKPFSPRDLMRYVSDLLP